MSSKPEEDDDDWFTKDIDDFDVPDIKKPSEGDAEAETGTSLLESLKIKPKQFFDDIDGNYFDPFLTTSSGASSQTKFHLPDERDRYVQKIPFSKLLNLSENDGHELFLDIYSQKDSWIRTITQENAGDELMLVTMKILQKIGSLPMFEINEELFLILAKHDQFWDNLVVFFKRSTNQMESRKKKVKAKSAVQGVGTMDMLGAVGRTLTLVRKFGAYRKKIAGFVEQLTDVLNKANVKADELKQSGGAGTNCRNFTIYPTLSDLKGPGIDLKTNIVGGKFPSVEHYLEVHLNLLREDFMIPLREGIRHFQAHCERSSEDEPFYGDNIRVHRCVQLLLPGSVNRRSAKEELVIVDLDPHDRGSTGRSVRYQKLALQNSKRLMHGSMVCLTSGPQFEDLIVAIISHRDNEQLYNGYVCVEIIKMENINDIFKRDLFMIESEIFFEPYHHVFNVLKNLRADTFPLKSYIVDTQPQQQSPDYVSRDRRALFTHRGQQFNAKVPSEWPESGAPIGLNPSQYNAFKLALTRKFALIQGPPGTGKTFIGQEIISALVANTDHQILLICLTNHALDQFLCGVLNYTTSLVRMGSQSKHSTLDSYNVKQLNEDVLIDKRLRTCYYNTKQEYLKLMEEFEALQKNGSNEQIFKCLNLLQQTSRRIHELNQLSNYEFVKNIRVIGMTTTFAARNHTLLQLLRTPIVLIEEAAEVLESHLVATLTPATEHCILIGDHFQLRPTTSVYALSRQYQLDISLFERMIRNNVNAACLSVQHRMRPELADLIRPGIYAELTDHEMVRERPKVRGMRRNLFFFTHNVPEDSGPSRDEEKSKRNSYECKFLLGLCEYLVAQGYGPEDIVILTAYNGQMLHLVQERKGHEKLHGIRITVVDNYQGEEAKIVLLSLVRSNDTGSIGFLAFRNRICVALSRARDGLYIVGNMDLLAKANPMWQTIRKRLETHSAIGSVLELMCEEHMCLVQIEQPEDFEKVSYGGCQDMCRVVKECGHQCDSFCHGALYPHRVCMCNQDENVRFY
ncbi:NFX1-type zinc finger-containing protein 1 [Culex quinquefasciatus]|uniref:NFX1-type zinc finger-containing protein 1 n=1 Tax=Culex quinquefasciatus TaxID=7176 RepID=B0WXL3_CULQU|nr:NFX1-type zinc finger-containing protein 1 [Culex quinquefasciatus]|eukprot:XP_001862135.1 NFX1-type zinc finger-containing protein 1 [Culex quinquefasciatus]